MKLNRFLGELVGAPLLLNEWSYQFLVFGRPSTTEPWGWQLTGQHLVVTCFMIGGQMVMTPSFWGAEPRYIRTLPLVVRVCAPPGARGALPCGRRGVQLGQGHPMTENALGGSNHGP